jgi:hypothetical protein
LDDAEHAREISNENKGRDFSGALPFEQGEHPAGLRCSRAAHAGGIRALSTVAVDKVVNSVSAHALSGLQIRRFLSVMKM